MSKETTIWIVIAVYVLFMLAVGILNSKNSKRHGGVYGRRTQCRGVDFGLVLWHRVFFGGDVHRLFRRLWLEIWPVVGVLLGIGNAVFGSLLAWLVLAQRTREATRRIENQIHAPAVRNAVSTARR